MAERQTRYIAIELGDKTVGLYIARTPQQALAEHIKPLLAIPLTIEEGIALAAETGLTPVVVK